MFELFIARRYLKTKREGFLSLISIIAIGGVFVGVAAILIVLSVMNGFHNELRVRILGVTPHITVTRYFNESIDNYQELIVRLKQIRGVTNVAPFTVTKSLIQSERASSGIVVTGIEPSLEKNIREIAKTIIQGSFDISDNEILIGLELSKILGVNVGDRVFISATAQMAQTPLGPVAGAKAYTVKGIFDTGVYDFNSMAVFLTLGEAQRIFGLANTVTGIELSVRDIYKAQHLAKEITKTIGYPYRALDWITQNRNLFAALKMEKMLTSIVLTLIVIVAAFNIVGTLIMMVIRKTREIGILKAMGVKPGAIMRIFMNVGLLIGGIGTGAGVIVGLVVSWLLNKFHFINLPGEVFIIKTVPVRPELSDFILVTVAALLISLIATIYPSLKASRFTPVDAIRYE
jgi:lipoprotein-releasing system permease protein